MGGNLILKNRPIKLLLQETPLNIYTLYKNTYPMFSWHVSNYHIVYSSNSRISYLYPPELHLLIAFLKMQFLKIKIEFRKRRTNLKSLSPIRFLKEKSTLWCFKQRFSHKNEQTFKNYIFEIYILSKIMYIWSERICFTVWPLFTSDKHVNRLFQFRTNRTLGGIVIRTRISFSSLIYIIIKMFSKYTTKHFWCRIINWVHCTIVLNYKKLS